MPQFETTRRVPYSAAEMYAIAADVERYPEFLPLCTGLEILTRTAVPDGEDLTAKMTAGYKSMTESFSTSVHLRPGAKAIDARYLDGPFSRLENRWRFLDSADGEGCNVNFFIAYEFRSPMLAILAGSVFDQAFRKFSEAFEMRARKIYGARAGVSA